MPPKYKRTLVTPGQAAAWLDTVNTHNRNLRANRVAALARDILSGAWVENGDTIRFSEDGVLLDGQHRLAAVVQADTEVTMMVVTGLPILSQDTMDHGARRTLGDVLKLRGEANPEALAAVIRMAKVWWDNADHRVRGFTLRTVQTVPECLGFLSEHPELRAFTKSARSACRHVQLPATPLAVGYWIFAAIDEGDAAEYMAQLQFGHQLDQGAPLLVLRNRLATMARERTSYPSHYMLALMIKAWNAYRMGQQVQVLSYRAGGAAPEPFPEPK